MTITYLEIIKDLKETCLKNLMQNLCGVIPAGRIRLLVRSMRHSTKLAKNLMPGLLKFQPSATNLNLSALRVDSSPSRTYLTPREG